ncbi:Hypothetical protein PHPALM_8014 [Phytophthora palmivora]|uniref:Uncharacterized protein n=1 Tax=Phytophthora palmivora TaxID=4796 RepID=A0A2P4YAW4_9STRA|nr:Hypothetical protein PHPALM_8014 [Phytophthora palmivora]
MHYKGFRYTKAWEPQVKITLCCSVYRSSGCKARRHVYAIGWKVLINEHRCVHVQLENSEILEVIRGMKEMVDAWSVLDLPHDEITRTALSEKQISRRIYRTRRKHY